MYKTFPWQRMTQPTELILQQFEKLLSLMFLWGVLKLNLFIRF